jgi:hypothetical protein
MTTETSGRALVDHWTWAAKKGLMNLNTARSLRAACAQVLGVLDEWESVDIRELDVESVLLRFVNLRKKDFKPDSLESYKQRFRQALQLYLLYLEDPGGGNPRARERPNSNDKPTRPPRTTTSSAAPKAPMGEEEIDRAGLISYPFPLREGKIARLFLPADLKVAEVRRLTAYMMTLAVDASPPDE